MSSFLRYEDRAKCIVFICVIMLYHVYAQPSYENYHLVWSDEFDVDGLPNSSNWGYEKGCSVRNDELQNYTEGRIKMLA